MLGTRLSRPVRGAWIETVCLSASSSWSRSSRPVRGAWIETLLVLVDEVVRLVAPRAGRVD